MFNKSFLNDIRDRISIVSFIGERVPLKRAGRNFKGRCPFHNEKTPSFNVSDDKGIYHCFGCGEGGDVFQFVMKFEGLPFLEAVEFLARRAGLEMPKGDGGYSKEREDAISKKKRLLFRVNEVAKDYFMGLLFADKVRGKRARGYLNQRGISDKLFTQLFLGYADNSWDALVAHLQQKNVPLDLAAELGLIKGRDGGGYYDFFRDRIMFPIISPRGEILGFGGRDISGDEGVGKYINSPDSIIYHKSDVVFGINFAGASIRQKGFVVLVEGNLDLASLYQEGITNVVAPLGTALTSGQVRLLSRYTRNFVLIFDGDDAGKKASFRALEIFIAERLSPRVVPLPKGEDPDSFVRKEGSQALADKIKVARPLFEYFVDETIAECGRDATGRIECARRFAPVLGAVTDVSQRSIYRRYAATRLDMDEQSLELAASHNTRKIALRDTAQNPDAYGKASKNTIAISSAEKVLVDILLVRPDCADAIFKDVTPDDIVDVWCKEVFGLLFEEWREEGVLKIGGLLEDLDDEELKAKLVGISMDTARYADDEVPELMKDCVSKIKSRSAGERLVGLNEEIRNAEKQGDEVSLLRLLNEKKELRGHRT